MRIELISTDKIVELETATGRVKARIWEGRTDGGIAIHAYVTRIGVARELDASAFERELLECPAVRASDPIAAFPMRLLID
jgi:hypothetical protein